VKVIVVIVAGSIASLKVAIGLLLMATFVVVSAGELELTVGAVVSVVVPVVKVHTLLTGNGLPARSFIPVVILALYEVLIARSLVGLKIAVLSTQLTAPVTAVSVSVSVKVNVVAVQVRGSIGSLKVAVMFLLVATSEVVSIGLVERTVGPVVSEELAVCVAVGPVPALSSHPAMKTVSGNATVSIAPKKPAPIVLIFMTILPGRFPRFSTYRFMNRGEPNLL
jgi:hypothetical protein